MIDVKYKVGDEVWLATFEVSPAYITCPDCGGTGRLRVILADESIVSIGCRNCSCGYDPPTGRIKVYDRKPRAELTEITGCEIEGAKIEWKTRASYRVPEDELFDTEAAAMAVAKAKAEQFDRDERNRVNQKEKDTHTWAWNASYHRKCIKEAERLIAYHTAKLNVAKVKAKAPCS